MSIKPNIYHFLIFSLTILTFNIFDFYRPPFFPFSLFYFLHSSLIIYIQEKLLHNDL